MIKTIYMCILLITFVLVIVPAVNSQLTASEDLIDIYDESFGDFSQSYIAANGLPLHSLLTLGHYRIFDSLGNPLTLDDLVANITESDVTFLGEIHTDVVAHYLEVLLLEMAWDKNQTLSLEMFETDVQYVVNEYLAGHISEEHFLKSGRSWGNYDSDYRAMIEFSKEKGMPVLASNAPRRYINMVSRLGEESLLSLSAEAKKYLPPLPYPAATQDYENKFRAIMSAYHTMGPTISEVQEDAHLEKGDVKVKLAEGQLEEELGLDEEAFQQMLAAQNLWDASMAWSIASHLKQHPENRVLHVNGSFHSDYQLGIPEHLQNYLPNSTMLGVTIVPSYEFPDFSDAMQGMGDIVIVTDANLPPSH